MKPSFTKFVGYVVLLASFLLSSQPAWAHCDTLNGPVVAAARLALQKSDITPVLKWIRPQDEAEVRAAFAKTMAVRGAGGQARELADMYFFETLVRLHRAGEGEPYTGLKPAGEGVEPGIAEADLALDSGSLEPLVKTLTSQVTATLRQKYADVQRKQARAEQNVEAGREFVAAYVDYIHFVEQLTAGIQHETKAEHVR